MLSTAGDNGPGVPTADILREVVMSDCPLDLYQHLSHGGALLGVGCGETGVGVSDKQCPSSSKGTPAGGEGLVALPGPSRVKVTS